MVDALTRDAFRRSIATFEAIQSGGFYSRRRHLYGRRRRLFWRTYEDLWPFANAFSAVDTLASLGRDEKSNAAAGDFLEGLPAYSTSGSASMVGSDPVGFESSVVPPLGSGGDVFFDDNTWLGLAAMRRHQQAGNERELDLARRLLAFVVTGWSTEAAWSHPGGIRWKEPTSNTSRNTCSNAPVAELACLLHERDGDSETLQWAVRIYEWVRSALLRSDGLYADQIAPDGTVNSDIWSYNQGTMVGAGVLLHRITGNDDYLEHAKATATAATATISLEVLMAQDAAFNAVYFRNLLLLGRVSPDPSYMAIVVAYGDAMWGQVRDHRTGFFPTGTTSPLNDTAPMIEIYALIAGADPHP